MDEAIHCDRLGFMHQGRLVSLGRPDELTRAARDVGGPMITVEARDFARAFVLLRRRFPQAMLYGRRVRWQSLTPDADTRAATEALGAATIPSHVGVAPLSMEDTFVSVLRAAGMSPQ